MSDDGSAYGDSRALAVPPAPNVVRSASFDAGGGDAVVHGFWWLCPGCVGSAEDYELPAWVAAHPGAHIVAATCDSNVQQASAWIYEHRWNFPVIVYNGPLSFGECFSQKFKDALGFRWFGDTARLHDGTLTSDGSCAFPGIPLYVNGSC